MNPGRLREPIEVQKRANDSVGQHRSPHRSETPWEKDFDDRAKVAFDNQRSDIYAGKDDPEQRGKFLVRTRSEYRANDITEKRIVWEGMAFEIEAARPVDPKRRYIEVSTLYKGDAA